MQALVAEFGAPQVPWAALAVAWPLAVALACTVSLRLARWLVLPASLVGVLIAGAATLQVARHGAVTLAIGGWAPPLGIGLRIDGLACAFLLVAAAVGAAALAVARSQYRESSARFAWAFWPLAFCLLAALNAAFVSADLFNLFVALELLTVSAVGLVAVEGSAAALAAAIRYLLFALLGSLSFLLGVALLYLQAGTLDIAGLGAGLSAGGPATLLAAVLVTAGLMAKGALFPLHGWLAPAHAAAPAPASALLSALVVKAPFLILLRLWFEALADLPTPVFAQLMGGLGAMAILLGSVLALRQERLKLVIAYSTVAQLGYLLLVFPLAAGAASTHVAVAAWSGVVFHALSHALAKAAMFLSAGAMAQALGHDRVHGLGGLASAMPLSAFAFALAAVSLMGLPPSGGFLAKYLLLTAALGSGQWWWAVVMLAGGLLAAAYLFRPLGCLLAEPEARSDASEARRARVPLAGQAIALALALAAVLLGLFSAWPYRLVAAGRPWEVLP